MQPIRISVVCLALGAISLAAPRATRIYLGGPGVFALEPLKLGEEMKRAVREAGHEGLFPLDNTLKQQSTPHALGRAIFDANVGLMDRSEAIAADMRQFRGPSMDPGTSFEMGYQFGRGRPVLAYSPDTRTLEERTRAFYKQQGKECRRDDTGVLRDPDNKEIEPYGLHDNLMLEGAVRASGARIRTSLSEVLQSDKSILTKVEPRDPCAGLPVFPPAGKPRVYLAVPGVFFPNAKDRENDAVSEAEKRGVLGLIPLNKVSGTGEAMAARIFRENIDLMCQADAMIADMTPYRGPSLNAGIAFAMGFMAARGKRVYAYSKDPRNFTVRTVDFYRKRGKPVREGKAGELLRDPEKNSIERYDMPDNLMLGSVVERSEARVRPSLTDALDDVARATKLAPHKTLPGGAHEK